MVREVREETGLMIRDAELAFVHRVGAVRVQTYLAHDFARVGPPDDPDGVIVDVRRLPIEAALRLVRATAPRAISRPLEAWFAAETPGFERFTVAPSITRHVGLS